MKNVVTTVYRGQRKFLFRAGRHSVAVESAHDADCFDDEHSAAEAAFRERGARRRRVDRLSNDP